MVINRMMMNICVLMNVFVVWYGFIYMIIYSYICSILALLIHGCLVWYSNKRFYGMVFKQRISWYDI